VEHAFWAVNRADRVKVVASAIREHGRTIVFCRTRHGADRIAHQLGAQGIDAVAIHGSRSQGQRDRAIAAFSAGKAQALVATDVAARGIDVADVARVVNYDAPEDREAYVHRVGRTGRAGRSGLGISFVLADQAEEMRAIASGLGLEGFEPPRKRVAAADPPRTGSARGRRSRNRRRRRAKVAA
ncbi:MAG TPA: C-terminal helicase domain-containing protein, partial [Solirubrobacterales bacterium]|nr:C-terminal helicase domain-containing protein [Solirubrobacterales bacterium]